MKKRIQWSGAYDFFDLNRKVSWWNPIFPLGTLVFSCVLATIEHVNELVPFWTPAFGRNTFSSNFAKRSR